jgi:hypothetical protein
VLAFLSAAISAVGAVAGFIGQRKQAKAREDAAEANAEVAEANAKLVGRQIADTARREARDRGQIVGAGMEAIGRQRVGAAAVGLDPDFGSPLDAVYNSFTTMVRDLETSRINRDKEIVDLERERTNFTAKADASKRRAKHERSAGLINSIASAASGVGSVYKATLS